MMWAINSTIKLILGVSGNVASICLYVAPLPTFVRIYRKKSVESFSADPYQIALLKTMFWCFYGLPMVSDETSVATIGAIGSALGMLWVSIFLIFSKGRLRIWTWSQLLVLMSIFVSFVAIALHGIHVQSTRQVFVGVVTVTVTIAVHASPLTIIRMVIKTKSVEFMPFYPSLGCFICGLIWGAYGVYNRDTFITIPNISGTILGAGQIILYVIYYKKSEKIDNCEEGLEAKRDVVETTSNDARTQEV